MDDVSRTVLPSRRGGRRRDRRDRGLRGPLLPPTVPGARSRREQFDAVLLETVARLELNSGISLHKVEFGVEEVPPSDPAPWAQGGIALGRYFPAEPAAGLAERIVLYRRPIETRCQDRSQVAVLVRHVLAEQISYLTGLDPGRIDPDHIDPEG